jgi:pilus assembly protein Flp/PilA
MQALLRRLRKDGSAQAMVEYGLIIGLVALVVAGALFLLTNGLNGIFGNVTKCLSSPTSTTCPTTSTSSSSTTG